MSAFENPHDLNNVLVDAFGTVVAATRLEESEKPYYMYGHLLEIARRIMEKEVSGNTKNKKYPLVALQMDFEENLAEGIYEMDLNVFIIASSKPEYRTPERYTNVFKPVLYPIYRRLMDSLQTAGFFWEDSSEWPPHTKIDRPNWGIVESQGNVRNIINDHLDCIEIQNLRLKRNILCEI